MAAEMALETKVFKVDQSNAVSLLMAHQYLGLEVVKQT